MSSSSDNAYARWWLKSDNDTTAVVSFNVASLTDHSTGEWTVNIATDHATADYAALAMAELTSTTYSVANMRQMYAYSGGMAAGTCRLICLDDTATTHVVKDPTSWMAVGFGSQ